MEQNDVVYVVEYQYGEMFSQPVQLEPFYKDRHGAEEQALGYITKVFEDEYCSLGDSFLDISPAGTYYIGRKDDNDELIYLYTVNINEIEVI